MFAGVLGIREQTSRFDYDLDAKRVPIDLCRISFFKYFDLLAIDHDAFFGRLHVRFQIPQHRVVLQKMRKSFRVGDVVDGYDFDIFIADGSAVKIPANAAKAVNAYFYCHNCSSLELKKYTLQQACISFTRSSSHWA